MIKIAARNYYRYELWNNKGQKTYIGITNNPERREEEHRDEGMRFKNLLVKGPAVTEESARLWEQQAIETYVKNQGKKPRYNK